MADTFASGRWALGVCDRCAGVYLLKELKKEVYNQRFTGFLVCDDCFDIDNPQLQLGRYPVNDPQALENPRTDTNLLQSRALFGWNPVGNLSTQMYSVDGVVKINGSFYEPQR